MAHSNHYFRMKVGKEQVRHIDLLARDGDYNHNNVIQMVVKGPVYGTASQGEVGIWLTEQEQNELIAGILERRKVPSHATLSWLEQTGSNWRGDGVADISATNDEQSLVHPANE